MGTLTTKSETGLTCGNAYTRYVWGYNGCGYSPITALYQSTPSCSAYPTVTTSAISAITQLTATSGGDVTSEGDSPVVARGVCWSTSPGPTISANTFTTDGTELGPFVSSLSGLLANTQYYVRAYATNSGGTGYGNEVMFTTLPNLPVLTTADASNITQTTAASGGTVNSDGGGAVIARGVCWSTSTSPTISNNHTTDGTGTGPFMSSMTGLVPGTMYHVRAYATSSLETSYGSELSFSALPSLPVLTTTGASTITQYTATSGGYISSDGGGSITERGVCWNTSANPTIANSRTGDGPGIGGFTSNLTGLVPGTFYYIRAYAINSSGTGYGNQMSFNALPFTIGQSYGGGIIFYVDGTGSHGLISATTDQGGNTLWGCQGTTIPGSSTAIGAGQSNTTAIVNNCTTANIAARVCDNLVLYGYSDWFLPSKDELSQMYLNKNVIGGFINNAYWSSSEFDGSNAWCENMNDGNTYSYWKNYASHSVRAVRAIPTVFLPTVTNANASNITQTTVTFGGDVTADGGSAVTMRGVCWSTSPNPTTSNSYTNDGTGIGIYSSSLIGLTPGTLYYVKAYATNSLGTSYGDQASFTTLAP